MKYQLYHNDVIKWAKEYDGPPFHAIFCDPPYHLTSITRRFGSSSSAPAKFGKDGAFQRASKGFMQTTWDGLGDSGKGIAFDPDTWAALGEHLYPGGFGLAYASSRGWHRMACAIEDAGFIIQPSLFGWCFLSGFPKATRIDIQVDRGAGVKREIIGVSSNSRFNDNKMYASGNGLRGHNSYQGDLITLPATELAQTWASHRYGGQALKPALEPLICFQRPYEGRPVDCIVKTGAGALNIDQSRIPVDGNENRSRDNSKCKTTDTFFTGKNRINQEIPLNLGRWPANFYLRHSEYCTDDECIGGCPVRLLDEQSGEMPVSAGGYKGKSTGALDGWGYKEDLDKAPLGYNDSGPASRMFHQSTWVYEVAEQLTNAEPVKYEPKASSAEREAGLDSLETQTRHRVNAGGLENEPRFAPTQVKNIHPTIKPIAGNKYFATLLLPPVEYAPRRILIPFAGAGSEMIGSILAGWDEVIGIEAEANYIQIAEARLKWWSQWPGWGQNDVDTILQAGRQDGQQLSFLNSQ